MAFDLPNLADAAFPGQARLYSSDLAILGQAGSLTGVKTGCAVTAQGSPNMTLAVASGTIYWLYAEVTVAAGNVTITTANATHPRIDLVVASSAGVKSVIAGTPAAIPVQPPLGATSVALAQVYVPANDTAIGSTQIRDRRQILQVPSVVGAPSSLKIKTANETLTNVTLQNDDHLFFAMSSNGAWLVRFLLMMTQTGATQTMKVNFTAPAGAIWRVTAQYPNLMRASDGTSSNFDFTNGNTVSTFTIEGVVFTAATSGNFQLQWAQGSAAGVATMLKNSYLEYRLLA